MIRALLVSGVVLLAGCSPSAFLAGTILVAGIYDANTGALGLIDGSPPESARRKAPPMAAERKVIEVDCSQPLPETTANIRCR